MPTALELLIHRGLIKTSAAVAVAITLCGSANAAEGDVWTLQKIVTTNTLSNPATAIESVRYDAAGGSIEFTLGGTLLDTCPGGTEKVRFTWDFGGNATSLVEGASFDVALHGEQLGQSSPCTDYISLRSVITASGSKGLTWALPADEMKSVDVDRFFSQTEPMYARASAGGDQSNTTSRLGVDAYDLPPNTPLAYFVVRALIFGDLEFKIAYVYAKGAGTGQPDVTVTSSSDACGFALGSGIFTKWREYGGEQGILGCATTAELDAIPSNLGTIGRVATFGGGLIVWHGDGVYTGQTFAVQGCLATLYLQLGGTASWLGFPISDEYDGPGGRRGDFENGHIIWNSSTSVCSAIED